MKKKLVNFDVNTFKPQAELIQLQQTSKKDIAVIGISCKLGSTDGPSEFWDLVKDGVCGITDLTESRKEDVRKSMKVSKEDEASIRFVQNAFLNEIDKFDYRFFSLSHREANLMDPNQRLFLETAYSALEDAGYGGKKLAGTNTGVFLGFSSDFGTEYKSYVQAEVPELTALSTAGNIKSIIASRIAYLFDLKGPSMLVDTACSSSLVAVHLACRAIRNGECDYAIAGGVKVSLLPLKPNSTEHEIGIESSDGYTRTFDDSSDGTGFGEGVAAVLLKPLQQAINDGDQIYAVVKGSAWNQDGNSVGITAPNSVAQEQVILQAWQDADIDPETIAYIEAHGTGTKLGDPIEVQGIHQAFRKHTNKKQFCAIGSVKSNIGHLDHTAGIAGMIKAILALKNQKIPPTLHFRKPNHSISFEDSSVYVNDQLRSWEKEEASVRRCGVSSFGLSGTNCHVILEEAPVLNRSQAADVRPRMLALSSLHLEGLEQLVHSYKAFLSDSLDLRDEDIDRICYTANTGRGHYTHRLIIKIDNLEDLKTKLDWLSRTPLSSLEHTDMYYGLHKVVSGQQKKRGEFEYSSNEINEHSKQANSLLSKYDQNTKESWFSDIADKYIKGAIIDWDVWYTGKRFARISVPRYPFMRSRCWIEVEHNPVKSQLVHEPKVEQEKALEKALEKAQEHEHPLFKKQLAQTYNMVVFESEFNVASYWILNEHRVLDSYVVPGTTYLEMAREAFQVYSLGRAIEFRDVMFLSPLSVTDNEMRRVQTIISQHQDYYEFVITSRSNQAEDWIKHAAGKLSIIIAENATTITPPRISLHSVMNKLEVGRVMDHSPELFEREQATKSIQLGKRWNSIRKIYHGTNQSLAWLEMPQPFQDEVKQFGLHPSLLDCAANVLLGFFNDGLYLPLSYKKFKLYGAMPVQFYSHLKVITAGKESRETLSFDITMFDEEGQVFAEIERYSIKRVHEAASRKFGSSSNVSDYHTAFYNVKWSPVEEEVAPVRKVDATAPTIFLRTSHPMCDHIQQVLEASGQDVIDVRFGDGFEKLEDKKYLLSNTMEDFSSLLQHSGPVHHIVHGFDLLEHVMEQSSDLITQIDESVHSLTYLTKALLKNKLSKGMSITVLSQNANEVTGAETKLHPAGAAMFGVAKVITQEYPQLLCRSLDFDEKTDLMQFQHELTTVGNAGEVAYRNNVKYMEQFEEASLGQIKEVQIRQKGIYIITGGNGAIGLEIAKHLASRSQVTLAFFNRSPLPPREMWAQYLEQDDHKLNTKIRAIQEIESTGSHVLSFGIDVADFKQLALVVDQLRQDYGSINGIVHTAGVAGDGMMMKRSIDKMNAVIYPKALGSWNLHLATDKDDLDFFVLCSSISSFIGGVGQADYTAANRYLDAFAAYRSRLGKQTVSINWPAWKEVGMAVDYNLNEDASLFKHIPTIQAMGAFDTIINSDATRILLGEINPIAAGSFFGNGNGNGNENMYENENKNQNEMVNSDSKMVHAPVQETVQTPSEFIEFAGDVSLLQERLLTIWRNVFQSDDIDIHDNYYSIGGDSILAAHMLKEFEKEFADLVEITDIFNYPSIFELAEYLNPKLPTGSQPQAGVVAHSVIEKSQPIQDAPTSSDFLTEDMLDQLLGGLATGEIAVNEASKKFRMGGN